MAGFVVKWDAAKETLLEAIGLAVAAAGAGIALARTGRPARGLFAGAKSHMNAARAVQAHRASVPLLRPALERRSRCGARQRVKLSVRPVGMSVAEP